MARTFTQKILTLGAGLVFLCSVVACGGRGSVPATPATTGAGSARDAVRNEGGGSTTTTTTTYQRLQPLTFYTDGSMLSFLDTPVTVPTALSPLNTAPLAMLQLTYPITCAPPSGVVSASADRRTAVAASPTAPPTPSPTNLPVSSCLIVAYTYGGTTAIPVSAYGSIDGGNLIFNPLSPGPTYTLGTLYGFYIAYATSVTTTSDPCSDKHDHGHHYGNGDDRNEHDSGNHKDCGYHTGDGHNHHGGDDDGGSD